LKVVDALVKANKDFDLLIIPNGNHDVFLSAYFIRRQWDYFIRNLLGAEPSTDYAISQPEWFADLLR
jgi:dipeptidyl-peptidase 4